MGPKCASCPVAGDSPCLGATRPAFCRWAAGGEPVKVAHVVARSAVAASAPTPAFPPLMEQAGGLVRALGRWAAGGLRTTTEEERAERLAICRECEHFTGKRCSICGCKLAFKVAMKTEACPIGKWPAISPTAPAS